MHTMFQSVNLKGRDHMEALGVDWMCNIKMDLKIIVDEVVGLIRIGYDRVQLSSY
jgi:hypothetical protein